MIDFGDPVEVCLPDMISGMEVYGQFWTKITVTSSTLVNLPVSNNEMTSSMVISSKLGGASWMWLNGL